MPEILFFPYFGPNRHSEKRVIEFRLDFSNEDITELLLQVSDIRQSLLDAGVLNEAEVFPMQALEEGRINWYSSLLTQTTLLLQSKAGHRVNFSSVIPDHAKKRSIALVEHEHADVGMAAAKLAVELFARKPVSFQVAWRQFSEFARERILPFETEAIINAARQRHIPFFQFERPPLIGCIKNDFQVRKNGLLSLGHAVNSVLLDGTFCLSRAGDFLKALLRNPDQRVALLKQAGVTVDRVGTVNSANPGLFHLLIINSKITALLEKPDGSRHLVQNLHDSIIEQALAVSEKAGSAPIVITYQSTDITQSLNQSGGAAVDFELGPDLYGLFEKCPEGKRLLNSAAGDLIDWCFPDPKSACIPTIAVTGTNGKTTTSRMIHHVFQFKGYQSALVCTDGIFINQKQLSADDHSTFRGHALVLNNKQVNAAVLETHHRGIAVHGFAFSRCDVAVCLNVTEEHLAPGEIETVEEMAVIKRALVERGSHAVVLFADNAHCLAMLDFVKSEQTCLVSLQFSVAQLTERAGGKPASFCVLEAIAGESWITLHDAGHCLPVLPVSDIPATFNGTAVVNVSNAMHAIAACYFAGIDIASIKSAISTFCADQEFTPGRMNEFDGLPFRVIMDFAHNPDGIRKICTFADLQSVKGRKVIAFSGLGKRSDALNKKIAQAIAGHFDFYYCKDIEPSKPPKRRFTGPFMQKILIEEGVPRQATAVLTFGRDVIFEILDSCEPDDLLLLLVGHSESRKIPGYIQEYRERINDRSMTL